MLRRISPSITLGSICRAPNSVIPLDSDLVVRSCGVGPAFWKSDLLDSKLPIASFFRLFQLLFSNIFHRPTLIQHNISCFNIDRVWRDVLNCDAIGNVMLVEQYTPNQ